MKKSALKNFTKFTGKLLCQSLFFNKVAGLKPASLLKKRLWHRPFPINFAKFLGTLFYGTPLDDCFSKVISYSYFENPNSWKNFAVFRFNSNECSYVKFNRDLFCVIYSSKSNEYAGVCGKRYLKLSETSKIVNNLLNSWQRLAVNYFWKKLWIRCLTRFWMHLSQGFLYNLYFLVFRQHLLCHSFSCYAFCNGSLYRTEILSKVLKLKYICYT